MRYEIAGDGFSTRDPILSVIGSPSFLCILGSRMFFDLKQAAKLGVNGGISHIYNAPAMRTFTDPEFAIPDRGCSNVDGLSFPKSSQHAEGMNLQNTGICNACV